MRPLGGRLLIGLLILDPMARVSRPDEEANRGAARIAIAALLEQVYDTLRDRDHILRLANEPPITINGRLMVSVDSAVDALIALKKPTSCTAQKAVDDRVDLYCSEITDSNLLELMGGRHTTGDGWAEQLKRDFGALMEDPLLSFRTRTDTFNVPLSGLRGYFVQYLILGSCTLSRPDTIAKGQGAVGIVRLLPPTEVQVQGPGF